jgi:hypothetical protein
MEFEVIQKIELIAHTPYESMLQINMEMQMWREMKRKLKDLEIITIETNLLWAQYYKMS